jgi:molybdopterin molybdotransferase
MNCKNSIRTIHAPIGKAFKKAAPLTFFLKGYYNDGSASPLDAQESFRMSSFAKANCLIRIDENVMELSAGELVEIHLFPYNQP